jgi:hypothetical protein
MLGIYIRWLEKGMIDSTKYFVNTVNILSGACISSSLRLGKILSPGIEFVVAYH